MTTEDEAIHNQIAELRSRLSVPEEKRTCRWTAYRRIPVYEGFVDRHWIVACTDKINSERDKDWKFCPFCGGEIEEVK